MATAENSTLSICIPRVDEWVTDDYTSEESLEKYYWMERRRK